MFLPKAGKEIFLSKSGNRSYPNAEKSCPKAGKKLYPKAGKIPVKKQEICLSKNRNYSCPVPRNISVKKQFCQGINGTLVELKICTFTLESTRFTFDKCPISTHDGASVKFSTNSHETEYSEETILSRDENARRS